MKKKNNDVVASMEIKTLDKKQLEEYKKVMSGDWMMTIKPSPNDQEVNGKIRKFDCTLNKNALRQIFEKEQDKLIMDIWIDDSEYIEPDTREKVVLGNIALTSAKGTPGAGINIQRVEVEKETGQIKSDKTGELILELLLPKIVKNDKDTSYYLWMFPNTINGEMNYEPEENLPLSIDAVIMELLGKSNCSAKLISLHPTQVPPFRFITIGCDTEVVERWDTLCKKFITPSRAIEFATNAANYMLHDEVTRENIRDEKELNLNRQKALEKFKNRKNQ